MAKVVAVHVVDLNLIPRPHFVPNSARNALKSSSWGKS